jgi:spermidine/putrescine transport system substrate-binding protein
LGLLILIIGVYLWQDQGRPQQVLNLLCWTGYEEPQLLEPFERRYGVKVRYKTFVGGDAMYALLTQSKGQYDVVVVDPEYVEKLRTANRLSVLAPSDYDLRSYIPTFRQFPLAWKDGKMYAIPVEFGANALLYNTERISTGEAANYDLLFSDKVKGKVGVWDWYLPIMGVLSVALGNSQPYDISDGAFDRLRRRLMQLRPQIGVIAAAFPDLMTSLANGETLIVPGGAGWVAVFLQAQGKPYDWSVPKAGGIMWVDSLVIPTDAPHPDTARLYLQWMTTPEAQAALAQKKAFAANVPNADAYPLISPQIRKALRTENGAEADALARSLAVRTLPVQQSERTWQDAWEQFKASK